MGGAGAVHWSGARCWSRSLHVDEQPEAEDAEPKGSFAGPRRTHAGAAAPLRERHAARTAVSLRDRAGDVRDGLLLGRRAQVLGRGRRLRTAVGYAGGATPNPTYREVCSGLTGHTEVVEVVFDPKAVSYEALLKLFWENHDPTQGMRQGNDQGTQYRSAIYTHGPEQQRAAEASRDAYARVLAEAGHGAITTEIARGAPVLLRRGLPPAVPGEEPGRLLRDRRHRRGVSGRTQGQVGARVTSLTRLAPRRGAKMFVATGPELPEHLLHEFA